MLLLGPIVSRHIFVFRTGCIEPDVAVEMADVTVADEVEGTVRLVEPALCDLDEVEEEDVVVIEPVARVAGVLIVDIVVVIVVVIVTVLSLLED